METQSLDSIWINISSSINQEFHKHKTNLYKMFRETIQKHNNIRSMTPTEMMIKKVRTLFESYSILNDQSEITYLLIVLGSGFEYSSHEKNLIDDGKVPTTTTITSLMNSHMGEG